MQQEQGSVVVTEARLPMLAKGKGLDALPGPEPTEEVKQSIHDCADLRKPLRIVRHPHNVCRVDEQLQPGPEQVDVFPVGKPVVAFRVLQADVVWRVGEQAGGVREGRQNL